MADKILVVDDETDIADLIEVFLINEHFEVSKCGTAEEALYHIEREDFDLVILDIMLPDSSGFDLCKTIRKSHTYPIIMLTSRTDGIDRVTGLSLGADDYVTKPFLPVELIARVKAQIRRVREYDCREKKQVSTIAYLGLALNKTAHECRLNGEEIKLTPTEFSILWLLCENRGRAFSAEELFEQIWGEKYYTNSRNPVMVQIRHIREKLRDTGARRKYIKTIWGVGYIIE